MSSLAWMQLLTVVVLGTIAQVALKAAVDVRKSTTAQNSFVLTLLRSPLMWTWFLCYVASTLLWLWALRAIPLSQAFPVLGLQFAMVPLASSHFLREKLGKQQWLGVVIVVIGVVLVGK